MTAKNSKSSPLESSIQAKILKWLKQNHPSAYVRKIITANETTVDVLMCLQGRFVAFEIKRPGEKPTPLQWRNIFLIQEAGGISFWIDNLRDLQYNIMLINGGYIANLKNTVPAINAGLKVQFITNDDPIF